MSFKGRHRDKNFGVIFCVWDRLFKTHYEQPDEYPDTGIQDAGFPLASTMNLKNLLLSLLRQHLYPFQAIGRDLKAKLNLTPAPGMEESKK